MSNQHKQDFMAKNRYQFNTEGKAGFIIIFLTLFVTIISSFLPLWTIHDLLCSHLILGWFLALIPLIGLILTVLALKKTVKKNQITNAWNFFIYICMLVLSLALLAIFIMHLTNCGTISSESPGTGAGTSSSPPTEIQKKLLQKNEYQKKINCFKSKLTERLEQVNSSQDIEKIDLDTLWDRLRDHEEKLDELFLQYENKNITTAEFNKHFDQIKNKISSFFDNPQVDVSKCY